MDTVEHVDGVDGHARVEIAVGNGEEIGEMVDVETGLLAYLAAHALLYGLVHVDKAAGQVEGVLRRLLAATGYEQLAALVEDEGGGG